MSRGATAELAGFFFFELGDPVQLAYSKERGMIIGRAEYLEAGCNYLVRYKAGDGRQIEAWWNQSALVEKS